MAIVRCKKGHHYDSEKFSMCPYCGIFVEDEEDKTIGLVNRDKTGIFDDDKTVAMKPLDSVNPDISDQDDKTIGIYKKEKGSNFIAGWLVCLKGPEKGRDYRLYHGFNRVGRDYTLEVAVMEDPSISREASLAIVYDGRGNQFYAVQQSGGIAYLNGALLEAPKAIKTGDTIETGKSAFEFIAFCREGRVWERD